MLNEQITLFEPFRDRLAATTRRPKAQENIIFATPKEFSIQTPSISINVTEATSRIENLALMCANRIANAIFVLAFAVVFASVSGALVLAFGPKIFDMMVARFSQGQGI